MTRWTLAHQGGWDELLMFGLPIVLAVLAVRWAEKRGKAKRVAADRATPDGEPQDAEH
ncbi:MAG TPA: hypothetical protein VLG28_12290 [Acidimicrobiia bacterium]|nr:hypothetical protein [Acidimicrobiia bacterium]